MADTTGGKINPIAEMGLTEREMRHLAAAWLAHNDPDNIDYDKFMLIAGHPNANNARKRFGEIKKKVRQMVFGGTLPDTPAKVAKPTAKPTATPRKRKTAGNADGTIATPTKRAKKTTEEDKEDPGNETEDEKDGEGV